jgi:hypothetical protein
VAYGTLVALAQTGTRSRDVQLSRSAADPSRSSQRCRAADAAPPRPCQLSHRAQRLSFAGLDVDQPIKRRFVIRGRMWSGAAPVPFYAPCAGIDRFYADKPFTLKVIPKYTREAIPISSSGPTSLSQAGFRRELDFRAWYAGHVEFLRIGSGSEESRTGAILR